MQMNVAGLRRNIKNLAHNYSDAQIKVREATSNDPWGPSATIMAEIADLTYNVVAFSEIMQMIWKRLNDHGKNWRHVYKALILLEYLIKTGTERVAQQCKENIFAIQTLREFVYFEEGKDQGIHVREKAKQLVILLRDDERLKNERAKALKAKERFAQHPSGFGSDGYIDGPTNRDTPPGWGTEPPKPADVDFVRPQTAGEEELQLQLAMAMSREEAEQEEAKRRSDDVRLQLALSQSEQDFKRPGDKPDKPQQSHLMDLLDISLGAASLNSPTDGAVGTSDPWGTPTNSQPRSDPWSGASSPPVVDPWLAPKRPPISVGASAESWRTQSPIPSIPPHVPADGWSRNSTPTSALNGNPPVHDPWALKGPPSSDPWLSNPKPEDPWLQKSGGTTADPWATPANNLESRPSPVGAITSPISDLDEFDIITNRNKTGQSNGNSANNNNSSLLDDMDPLSAKKPIKSPQSFLGENSSLVNLDNLIKPVVPNSGGAAYNPFSDTVPAAKPNLFQQQQQAVPSINQLKQQPFPVTLNQDPWAPVNSNNTTAQLDEYFFDCESNDLSTLATNNNHINNDNNNSTIIRSSSNNNINGNAYNQTNFNSIDTNYSHFFNNQNYIQNEKNILIMNSDNTENLNPAAAAIPVTNFVGFDLYNNSNKSYASNINNTSTILGFDNINYLDNNNANWIKPPEVATATNPFLS